MAHQKPTFICKMPSAGTWQIVLLVSFLFSTVLSSGKNSGDYKIDSLQQEVNSSTGTRRITSQLELAVLVLETNTDKALDLANSALLQSKKEKDKSLEMQSYNVLGRIYFKKTDKAHSLLYLDSALQISNDLNENWYKGEILFRIGTNKHQMGEKLAALETFSASVQACLLSENFKVLGAVYSMMGTIFRINGLYDRAIEYIIKSKLNYEKVNYTEGSAWTAYLLGRTYFDLKLYDQALNYFNESLEIYKKLAEFDGVQNGVAICYEQIGMLKLETGLVEEARESINRTLKIYTDNNSKLGLSNVYTNLGIIEYSSENYVLAEEYFRTSLEIKEETRNILGMPRVYEYLGLSQIKNGNKTEGFKNVQLALDMALKNNQKKVEYDIYSQLSEIYLSLNDLKNAVVSQKKQIEIQELLLSGGASIKTEQLQAIYEIEEKNNQIAQLEKQNEINALTIKQNNTIRLFMIIGIVLALFTAALIYWLNTKLRLKNKELNETNAAKDKFFAIISHDLRGPTGALAGVLKHLNLSFDEFSNEELKEVMVTLHNSAENVSNLLENLLVWAQSQVQNITYNPTHIALNELIISAKEGLQPQTEDKEIKIQLQTDDSIIVSVDQNMVQTIFRNILSNAIKFSYRGGKINITTEIRDKSMALIQIIDEGVGIDKNNLSKLFDIAKAHHTQGTENEQSTGLGLILVKEFVEKNQGTLSIKSEKDKGTIVSIALPLAI
ncbi:tetratricopeptide repeat-containing sensor histidine kinase [uncultured Draconibacterium sp.]|uniref:tetratricopeptide repeat-containing sensor histidine kinase n=1 Tax=uncultured Draconibacterium sp. TaxID=1573823 RepID=UPI003217E24F